MYHLTVKNRMHHVHIPRRHDMVIRMGHVVHDERFLVIMGAVILPGLLITPAVLAAPSGNRPPVVTSAYPYFPYWHINAGPGIGW